MSRHSKVLLILGTATLCVYIFLFFAESKKTEISHLAMNKKHIRESELYYIVYTLLCANITNNKYNM